MPDSEGKVPEDLRQHYGWCLGEIANCIGDRKTTTTRETVAYIERIARVEQERDQLRAILRDMCAIAGTDEWDKAMTGRQIILRKAISLAWPNGSQVQAGNGSNENG